MAQVSQQRQFGRIPGNNLARRWLLRIIRVEQNHAEYWLNWAEGANIPCEEILHWVPLHGTQILANWCEDVSRKDTLAAGIATTNYAVESATGEWSPLICESKSFTGRFPARITAGSLRWLQLHAGYGDTHPWEGLNIVCTLMGNEPQAMK
ncbi:MAG: hypothetical protein ABI386_04380 [Rhodanobacter sp.]